MKLTEVLMMTFRNFNPVLEARNPVMFVTEISLFVSVAISAIPSYFGIPSSGRYEFFYITVTALIFLTLLFSNLGAAISEGKSRSITESLQKLTTESVAHLLKDGGMVDVTSSKLKKGEIIHVKKNEPIPIDGEIIRGSAYVNESNITGESRPILKVEGDAVTGSTILLSDGIDLRVTHMPGETFIDKMIDIVKGTTRSRTPNEIALNVLLSGLTLVFLIVVSAVFALSHFLQATVNVMVLVVLLISLIPTTIGGLLPAIGIASINMVSQFNIIAKSGRAVENAGDVDTIILDKTGTITMGEREAVRLIPNNGVSLEDLAQACYISSKDDSTREGMSILKLASSLGAKDQELNGYTYIPFSPETKISGVIGENTFVVKGALKALKEKYDISDKYIEAVCKEISSRGGTAIPVVRDGSFIGVIELNDMLKPGIRERIEELKKMEIKTIMCTGDDEVTAAYMARESGIEHFIANSTPIDKYNVVKEEKKNARMVAMVGDGTNDAPALAYADVGLAMNNGTPAAKEAANMIDLDNNPTKLIDLIFLGKQILITRGSLTAFSIANDLAKYFVIIPAAFSIFPKLDFLNLLGFTHPLTAITSALIFNTIIIIILIPLALRGVRFRPSSADEILRRNLLFYGLGGVITPFIAIYIIYVILLATGVVW